MAASAFSGSGNFRRPRAVSGYVEVMEMAGFLLFCILAVLCWPLALLALILFPIVWLLLLPLRLLGMAVAGVFEFIGALFLLPAKIVKAIL